MQAPTQHELVNAGCDPSLALAIEREFAGTSGLSPVAAWRELTASSLARCRAFEAHALVRSRCFANPGAADPAEALWLPDANRTRRANLTALIERAGMANFDALHHWSLAHRDAFWRLCADAVSLRFQRAPSTTLSDADEPRRARWFPDAQLNIVDSCFTAPGDAPAVVEGDASGALRTTSYVELRTLAGRVCRGLRAAGLGRGDAVAIVMPMNTMSVALYLGIVQAGCVVVSIPDSFAWPQIRTRLEIADARVIFTVDHIHRNARRIDYYARLEQAEVPIVVDVADPAASAALRPRDARLSEFLPDDADLDAHPCASDEPINILFSSGTTGAPKAIPWTHITPLKCASDGLLYQDIHPGDRMAWPTNLGWMMGPWLIFATLMNRATMALYTDTPTAAPFGAFLLNAGVNRLGVIPSIVRQWRTTRCMEGFDLQNIQLFSSTGECSNDQDMFYLMYLAGYRPVIEYCGGTEVAGGYLTSTVLHPNVPATFSTSALGIGLHILDDNGRATDRGEAFLIPPGVGLSQRLLNKDHDAVYFEQTPRVAGHPARRHGDLLSRSATGYFRVEGRADDAMNLGGIKVSPREIEEAVESCAEVSEAAAVAVDDEAGAPARLVIFALPEPGTPSPEDQVQQRAQRAIRDRLNPLFKVDRFVWVRSLPRTASHKVMRRRLREDLNASDRDARATHADT